MSSLTMSNLDLPDSDPVSRKELPKLGQHLLTVLQVLVTVGLLWWLFHDETDRKSVV